MCSLGVKWPMFQSQVWCRRTHKLEEKCTVMNMSDKSDTRWAMHKICIKPSTANPFARKQENQESQHPVSYCYSEALWQCEINIWGIYQVKSEGKLNTEDEIHLITCQLTDQTRQNDSLCQVKLGSGHHRYKRNVCYSREVQPPVFAIIPASSPCRISCLWSGMLAARKCKKNADSDVKNITFKTLSNTAQQSLVLTCHLVPTFFKGSCHQRIMCSWRLLSKYYSAWSTKAWAHRCDLSSEK